MSANFTRRRDLFIDAGFADPDDAVAAITDEVKRLGIKTDWDSMPGAAELETLRQVIAPRLARIPEAQRSLARLIPQWLIARSGDLATALWLARAEHGSAFDLPGFLLSALDAFILEKQERNAFAFARFMLDLRFDWGRVYSDPKLAYAFLEDRQPNPLVWRLLEELAQRHHKVKVLELGCGIGNDAMGLLRSPWVESYLGVDASAEALATFEKRTHADPSLRIKPALTQGDFVEVLEHLPAEAGQCNLVYSYSSLHYFSSGELRQIYQLIHRLLSKQSGGLFAFGIKGFGSIWDGQGVPIYRPDVWINWDGQSRWFPNHSILATQLDQAGFEVRFHELHDHWGYSEHGKRDVFHYVLCSPRPTS